MSPDKSAPTAIAPIHVRIPFAGARFATNTEVTLLFKRVMRDLMFTQVVVDHLARPVKHRMKTNRAEFCFFFHLKIFPQIALVSAHTIDPNIELRKYWLEWRYFIEVATKVRITRK